MDKNLNTIAMNLIVGEIKQKHIKSGIDVYAPATLSEIREFERRISFSLPADFSAFYLTCNGFGCNEDIFNMIPLQHIIQNPEGYGDNWFYFAEYMIYSEMWGLRRTPTGQFEIFFESYPEKTITSSLTVFLQRFLAGSVFEKGGLYEWHKELGMY